MTALSADRNTQSKGSGTIKSYPVEASVTIYKGGQVVLSGGYARPARNTVGELVIGIADEKVDNSAGSAGAKNVRVLSDRHFLLVAAGMAQTDVGKPVFALDDQTVQLAPGAGGNLAGYISEYVSATSVWVYVSSPTGPQAEQASAGVATAVAGAATLSQLSGTITSEALTTAAAAQYTLTLTNTKIAATSRVFASVDNGTNTQGVPVVTRVTPGAGSVVILVQNNHASQALNGTLKISFFVIP